MRNESGPQNRETHSIAQAAWHSLVWLVVANAVGALIAILLLAPGLNHWLGEWSYGRWMTVHMDLELYGWTSLPLIGFLFHAYRADRGVTERWCRPILWVWSSALAVGAISWLSGRMSGKLFLDWSGYAEVFFLAAILTLWLLLLFALVNHWQLLQEAHLWPEVTRICGLILLLAVPFVLFAAAGPKNYPPVNPDSGGPTGASQLESTLAVVAIVLMLPLAIAQRKIAGLRSIVLAWMVWAAELVLCFKLGRGDASNHLPSQYLSLATLLVWLPLTRAYFSAFWWNANTQRWRSATLWWWSALLLTGWITFLPGVLDRFKFTDGLVGHSFIAMAGFTSSLIILVMVQLLGEAGWIFNRLRSFVLWNASVIAYATVMVIAGWFEGSDPSFTIVPGPLRNVLYILRLLTGILMLIASIDWLRDASSLLRRPVSFPIETLQEKTA